MRWVVLIAVVLLTACATQDYRYGTQRADIDYPLSPVMEQQVLMGKPHALLDKSDWIWPGSWLAKLFLWNRNIDSHVISDETIEQAVTYLQENELEHVQLLVNAYNPGNQWRRLVQNKTVGAGWRYTLGVLSVVQYTILPGRFFGGDAYNPYTNTIYLYSDDISIALHEAGHAKDSGRKKYKGSYGALYMIPLVPLYHEAVATSDALSYQLDKNDTQGRKESYKTLHPAYGTYVAGSVGVLGLIGAIPGHITGNIAAAFAKSQSHDAENDAALLNASNPLEPTAIDE